MESLLKRIVKTQWKRLNCNHNFKMVADAMQIDDLCGMGETYRYHDMRLRCVHCGKEKDVVFFTKGEPLEL